MRRIIIYTFLIAFFTGCQYSNKSKAFTGSYKVELTDSLIISMIKDYAAENELKPHKDWVFFEISKQYDQDFITVSTANSEFGQYSPSPSFYSEVDGFLVVIYTDLNDHINLPKVKKELKEFVKSRNMILEDELGMIIDPPIWRATRCNGENVSIYRTNKFPWELRGIPCGYRIFRSTEKYDSLYLVRD